MQRPASSSERGQILPLFALSLVALLLLTGLVVDVGYASSQQRTAQNAADFAALAGARVLGESYTGRPAGAGTAQNVADAVASILSANNSQLVRAQYVDGAGIALGDVVATGAIPTGALGVVVNATTSWHPFFLGIIGMDSWSAGVNATAITSGVKAAGVMPIGVQGTTFNSLPYCDPSSTGYLSCLATQGVSATAKLNGGFFGWLKFGAQGKCTGFGLGMDPNGGCESSQGFLDGQIGPPPNSYGCCTDLSLTPDQARRIGNLTGNKVSKNFQWYIDNQVIVWVPIWDVAGGTGSGGYYHIIGYGAMVFTDVDKVHGEWLKGVRVSPGYGDTPNGEQLGATGEVQLVR